MSCSVSAPTDAFRRSTLIRYLKYGVGEIAAGRIDVLLHLQHVEERAHADLLAQDVRGKRALGRHDGLLEGLHRRRGAVDAGKPRLRLEQRRAAGAFEVLARSLQQRDGLAHA